MVDSPVRSPHQYGRLPVRHTMRTMWGLVAMRRHLARLGPAPAASNDWLSAVDAALPDKNWEMMGNDLYGDCTFADGGHTLMLRTANASKIIIPTDADVLAAYSACTGFDPNASSPDGTNPTDQGADETTVCQFMETTGLLGHKSAGTGMVDHLQSDHIKWCIQLFGSCRIGVQIVQAAEDQFNAGQPWDVGGDQTVLGLHDVPLVGYKGDNFVCITWGTEQAVTRAWLDANCSEAHCEVYPDWVKAQGQSPSGFDLAALLADIAEVGA